MPSYRAFTLIELLVVIAVIGLLVSLILPALGKGRQSAQRAASLANIRSNAFIIAQYQGDNKDEFINPFDRSGIREYPNAPLPWVWPPVPLAPGETRVTRGWCYGPPYSASASESFGYHWIAHTYFAADDRMARLKSGIAPADQDLQLWYKENNDSNAQSNPEWIFPSSYWYPPVFWQDHTRFQGADRLPATQGNRYFFRRNRSTDVLTPSAKVLLFENKDFVGKGRPMWNTTLARQAVAVCDGSARGVNMADIINETGAVGGREIDRLLAPAGNWNPGATEMDTNMLYGRPRFDWSGGFTAARHTSGRRVTASRAAISAEPPPASRQTNGFSSAEPAPAAPQRARDFAAGASPRLSACRSACTRCRADPCSQHRAGTGGCPRVARAGAPTSPRCGRARTSA